MTQEVSKENYEDVEINFGDKNIEINLEYLNKIKSISKNIYSDIKSSKIDSGIPGIFILFQKILNHLRIEYNLKLFDKDGKYLKYKEGKEDDIKKLKKYIEEETLILKIFEHDKSLLNFIIYDLLLFVISNNNIFDPTLDKNDINYNHLFSLIKTLVEIEFNIEEKIKANSLDVFYSLFYYLFVFEKEINHILEIYTYLLNKFQENNILNENDFINLFMKVISEKNKLYKKQDLISIYLFNETIFQILNIKSKENINIISLFKNIVPEFITLNELLNLNGREIYTFIELIKIEELLNNYNNNIKKELFELIINSSNYEISLHLNIYLNQQENENSENIILLSENSKEIKNKEVNNLFNNLNKIYKYINEKIGDKRIKYILITEIYAQELKKYNNYFYYFIILRNLLIENDGEAFEYSKNIFQIILNKYLFQKCPQEENDIQLFLKNISDENNSLIKNYFYIVKNPKIKVFLEEIIIQIFSFHLNGYFMKYTDKINDIISYKNLDKNICKNIFEDNLPFLKASIKFLEDELENSRYETKILSTLFCSNFIQNYFYQLIKYIYDNKDTSFDQLYDYTPIINVIDGEENNQTTPFRFSIKILFMRLLYYNFGSRKNETYENFKNFDFEGRKITFRSQFKDDKKFEDSIPKLINYCKIFLEDYDLDETFKYIYGKDDKNIENKLSKIYYNLSYYSISFISDASYRAKFISLEEKMNIHINTENTLKENEDIFNYQYTELSYNYLSIMTEKLSKILEKEKSILGNFEDNNPNYNERILGILIYSFRICFISLIKKQKGRYFYEYILSIKDDELVNFLKESYVPGFNSTLSNESFNENDFDGNIYSNDKIIILILKFIFYSSLFYSYSQENISESNTHNFTINKNKSCLQTLIKIWNVLEKELNNKKISKIEIFLNLISKYLPEYLEIFLVENSKNENKKYEFQN